VTEKSSKLKNSVILRFNSSLADCDIEKNATIRGSERV